MLASSSALWAQNAVVKGKFRMMLPNHQNVDRVYYSKPEDGDLVLISESMMDKGTQLFSQDIAPSDQNTIRYFGVYDEQYPVYMKKGEELTIDAGDGLITYSGKLSKENKVFADWYKLISPIRKYGFTKNAQTLPSDRLAFLIDSLAAPVSNFIKNINTGNAAFDKQLKHMLPYSYKMDLIMPFAMGVSFGKKTEYPAFYANWFNNETFSDKSLWDVPMAYRYMQYFSFAKHIIYNTQQGLSGEMLAPEIKDKELRAHYVLSQVEKGVSQDRVAFIEKFRGDMITDQQKTKMAMLEKRTKAQFPGGDWIDFAYPDLNGKVHRLSDNLGKVVLIDVWATWCKPCLAEQPALEQLEKSFEGKDVVFISLSIDTDKAKWKEMVEGKKLSGLHLYSNSQGPIVQDYELVGVPRFILFDKNGKTVSFDAPRPSDPKLKELITSKL